MKLSTFFSSVLTALILFSGSVLASNGTSQLDITTDLQQRIDARLQSTVETADARQLADQKTRLELKEWKVALMDESKQPPHIFLGPQAYKLLAKLAK